MEGHAWSRRNGFRGSTGDLEDNAPRAGQPDSALLEALVAQLQDIADQLSDLALDRLRVVSESDGSEEGAGALSAERRLTRARRAIERAVSFLSPSRAD